MVHKRVRPLVVEEPELVVVDHGGPAYVQEPAYAQPAVVQPTVVHQPAVVQVQQPAVYAQPTVVAQPAVVAQPTVVAQPAVYAQPAVVSPNYGYSGLDPLSTAVLRGSTAQAGDPLGLYPGGGLDPRYCTVLSCTEQEPRVDPALVPAARANLAARVRQLQDQLDILTTRLGGRNRDTTLDL